MNDSLIAALAWLAVVAHVVVGIAAWRRPGGSPLVALLNLVVAVGVLAYWVPRWYGYAARGIQWYASDQLLPLCALVVCALAIVTLTGRASLAVPHWIIFVVDAIALLGAAAFVSFFRMTRLF